MQVRLIRQGGLLAPFDSVAEKFIQSKKNDFFVADLKNPRNYEYHKRFFKLLDVTFPYWNPEPVETKYGKAEPTMEQYRRGLIVLAGYHEVELSISGKPILVPKSMSFSNMKQEEFEGLYSDVLDVILQKVLVGWTIEQADELVGGFL